jgi:hypothetical protein
MGPIVHTRPERTAQEIRADQQAADAFFARVCNRTANPNKARDNRRIAERESRDFKILMASKEGSEWAGRFNTTAVERRARAQVRFVADPLNHRDDSKLRPYVHPAVRAAMPAPILHRRPKSVVDRSRAEAASWRFQARNWSKAWGEMKIRQSSVPFEHWLLEHPEYGITDENAPITVTRDEMRRFHYKKGTIRPAGLSSHRILEIALAALEARGGKW